MTNPALATAVYPGGVSGRCIRAVYPAGYPAWRHTMFVLVDVTFARLFLAPQAVHLALFASGHPGITHTGSLRGDYGGTRRASIGSRLRPCR
jgi:hypothetical protein